MLSQRDYARLEGCHPDLISKVVDLMEGMALLYSPMFVVEGLRTTERQQAIYAQGHGRPGTPGTAGARGSKK